MGSVKSTLRGVGLLPTARQDAAITRVSTNPASQNHAEALSSSQRGRTSPRPSAKVHAIAEGHMVAPPTHTETDRVDEREWAEFLKSFTSLHQERSYWVADAQVEGQSTQLGRGAAGCARLPCWHVGSWRHAMHGHLLACCHKAATKYLSYTGTIPKELEGTLLKNGPGQFEIGGQKVAHPFDGDGMVAAFAFKEGRCFFSNRFVRTKGVPGGVVHVGCKFVTRRLRSWSRCLQCPLHAASCFSLAPHNNATRMLGLQHKAPSPHDLLTHPSNTCSLYRGTAGGAHAIPRRILGWQPWRKGFL